MALFEKNPLAKLVLSVSGLVLLLAGIAGKLSAQDALDAKLDAEQASDTATAITVIFDCSGSMGDRNKIQQAKRAFDWWLNGVPDSYRFCLIRCEGNPKVVVPIGGSKQAVASAVKKFRPGAGTPIVDSLELAGKEIARRRSEHSPYERHVIVLFTDGRESRHKGGIPKVREEVAGLRNLLVEVMGIGFHGEGGYLSDVATNYYEANDEQQLRQGLAKVDAEVDLDAELDVSPQDLQTMQEIAAQSPPISTGIPVGLAGDHEQEDANVSGNGQPAIGIGLLFGGLLCGVFGLAVVGIAAALFFKILRTGRRR